MPFQPAVKTAGYFYSTPFGVADAGLALPKNFHQKCISHPVRRRKILMSQFLAKGGQPQAIFL
jgi:hypothetical protein